MSGVVALALVLAGAVVVHHFTASASPSGVVRQMVYTAPTATDSAVALPTEVRDDLHEVGLQHGKIALTRVEADGSSTTEIRDLTPRVRDDDDSAVLTVPQRASEDVDRRVEAIVTEMTSHTARLGSRALYTGLTRTDFFDVPAIIVSSGLDLADPVDFRRLAWSVPAAAVVATVTKSHELAALHGPVTFVVVPTAGAQPQLAEAQKTYRNDIWRALLMAGGATSVRFLDASGSPSTATVPTPVVDVPDHAITPERPTMQVIRCPLPASYFVVDTATLIDPAATARALAPCVSTAARGGATFQLDGWTSYTGPLDAAGRPARDDPANQRLSADRVNTVAAVLIEKLGVGPGAITRRTGHGNVDQPDPDPASPANRVVRITATTP